MQLNINKYILNLLMFFRPVSFYHVESCLQQTFQLPTSQIENKNSKVFTRKLETYGEKCIRF